MNGRISRERTILGIQWTAVNLDIWVQAVADKERRSTGNGDSSEVTELGNSNHDNSGGIAKVVVETASSGGR